MKVTRKRQTALTTPFDPTNADIPSNPENVQQAIEDSASNAQGYSKGFIFTSYTGKANTGRYLEFFNGIASDVAPINTVDQLDILEVEAQTTAANATCTLGWYDISGVTPVLLHTTTFTAQKNVSETGTPLSPVFSLPAGGSLAVKVDSGSISTPHIYFVVKGN